MNAVKSAGLLTVLDAVVVVGLDILANSVLTVTLVIEGFLVEDLARAELAGKKLTFLVLLFTMTFIMGLGRAA